VQPLLTSYQPPPQPLTKEVVMKTQVILTNMQSEDPQQLTYNPRKIGNKAEKTVAVNPTAPLAMAFKGGTFVRLAAGIALATFVLVTMSFAQSPTPSDPTSDPSTVSHASSAINNVDSGNGDVLPGTTQQIWLPTIPPLKGEELTDSDGSPKIEGAEPSNTSNMQAAGGVYDVGVIPETEHCPAGSELIAIYMDDEDSKNADHISGWTGSITQPGGRNTRFVFCRINGLKFSAGFQPYAVLSLASQCPPGSVKFQRKFENECSDNRNDHSGNIWPNQSTSSSDCDSTYSYTNLNFCLFQVDPYAGDPYFPDFGPAYGVFAASNFHGALATGNLHTDDEDDDNQNSYDSTYSSLGWEASNIISGGRNTDISVVKVKNATAAQPLCTERVPYYDGTYLSAKWDGANCYIKAVPTGVTPFIYNNAYYITADKSNQCLAGTWDTANCYFMPKPTGGFEWNDAFYVNAGPGHTCSIGQWDGAHCLVRSAPWGTHAFEWQGKWYFTTLYTCKDGAYDGANCYVMKAPSGTTPFIFNRAFYYAD
jgi:hypothetical protein